MSKNKKRKKNIAEIILVISALVLGALVIILVAGNKKKVTINGENPSDRVISGDVPLPSEIIDADKNTYFSIMEIPDVIFNQMNNVSYVEGCPVPRENLRYIKVLYWGSDEKAHTGELIVNMIIAEKTRDVFFELYKASYTIGSIELIDKYGGNDEVSMSYNNTSCFNARKINDTDVWSLHAYGMAIDLNPLYNPYISEDGKILPLKGEKYANRNEIFKMKIDSKDYAYTVFKKYGFSWGGEWEKAKDYQHFEVDL